MRYSFEFFIQGGFFMHGVVIIGAAGRMGRRLVDNVVSSPNLKLAGAVEFPGSPFVGQDAGVVAGCGETGVIITDSLEKALTHDAEAVIDFATSGVIDAAKLAVSRKCAMVIGTTALTAEDKAELKRLAYEENGRIVAANNMSIGVNLLFKLVSEAAAFLGIDYNVEIVEMHHNKKLDAPSGTAYRLGEVVCQARKWQYEQAVKNGRAGMVGKRPAEEIGMHALRGGDVVGDHTVIFSAEGERLELSHKASSRDMFARGALIAVEYLLEAPAGLYDMQDVLNLK
jgi:4-hydroxy-tetrahydrodipicolinate reductase